jgi:superfamily II DNA or RNA helicase
MSVFYFKMIANILTNRLIQLSNITAWEEEIVDQRFSAVRPRANYIDLSGGAMWDGVYRKYNRSNQTIARPLLGELRALCKEKDLALSIADKRPKPIYKPIDISLITEDFLPGIKLKQFQIDAIKTIYKAEVGVINVTMGGGKGELIAGICKAMPCPTAIIAEQIQVIEQLKQRLKLREVCEEPGLFYAGKMPSGQLIIIGSIQSLVKPKQKPEKPSLKNFSDSKSGTAQKKFEKAFKRYEAKLKAFRSRSKKADALHKLLGKCEMLLVDECDLATSTTYKNLFRYWFNGRRRYGMTGTPYDQDKPVENLVLQEHLGSVIYSQNRESVEKTGLIVPITYYALAYGEDGNKDDASAFDIAVNEMMVYSEKFHHFIAAICKRFTDEGTLILVERDDLGYALQKIIPDSEFIHGQTPRKKRPKILQAFEERKLKVLIGGKNVRRGLDLKGGCENLILATGGKLASEFKQRVARAARVNQKGSARIFDIYFLCNKYLYAHSRKRFKAAVATGYTSKIVFNDCSVEGEKFIKSRFHRPRIKPKKTKDLPGQKKLF